MSDYSTPTVTDESAIRLAAAVNQFADDVRDQIINVQTMVQETLDKQYTVNHEPKIDLPFENEYKYIHDELNAVYKQRGGLDALTHIFISGFLPNGKTIRLNNLEKDEQGNTVMKYIGAHINGNSLLADYTCRAEEGSWEKINILIVQAPAEKSQNLDGRLDIDYLDFPLENFKMIVYDDVENPLSPDIDSFLKSKQIDTLKYIGNLRWTFSGLCTLRRLEITKNILVINAMNCPCLQELIIPNVDEVPNTGASTSLIAVDISNVKRVANINNANLYVDTLKLKCTSLNGLQNCKIGTLYTGDACTSFSIYNTTANKVVFGFNISGTINRTMFAGNENITSGLSEIIFTNVLPITLEDWCFNNLVGTLQNITFAKLAAMNRNICRLNMNKLTTMNFTEAVTEKLNFFTCTALSEQSCLNIINALKTESHVQVTLPTNIKAAMTNSWYCKLENNQYVSCTSTDEGAVKQETALTLKGGTLQ